MMKTVKNLSRVMIVLLVAQALYGLETANAHSRRYAAKAEKVADGLGLQESQKKSKTNDQHVKSKNASQELSHKSTDRDNQSSERSKGSETGQQTSTSNRIQQIEKRIQHVEGKIQVLNDKLQKVQVKLQDAQAAGNQKGVKKYQKRADKIGARIEKFQNKLDGLKAKLSDLKGDEQNPKPDPAPSPEPTPDPVPNPKPDPSPEPTPDPDPTPDPTPIPQNVTDFVNALRTQNQVANFNKLFDVSVPEQGDVDAALAGALADFLGDPNFNQQTFLAALPKTAALYSELQLNAANREAFNLLFGSSVAEAGSPNQQSLGALFNVAGDSSFDSTAFFGVLGKTASLYKALQSDPAKLAAFNSKYSTQYPTTGSPSSETVGVLFNIAGDPNYSEQAFLASLAGTPDPDPNPDPSVPANVVSFVDALRANGQVGNYNSLFGRNIPATGNLSDAVLVGQIADQIGDPAFNQNAFLGALPKTAGLFSALQSDGGLRADFNLMFASNTPASGAPEGATIGTLFNVAGDPNFNQSAFLPVLSKTAGLYRALQSDTAKLSSFNTKFGTQLPASGSPPGANLGTLFGLAGDPNFNLEAFLQQL